jgi:integration host factor subunit beta
VCYLRALALAALNALAMTKSELIERITARQTQLSAKDVELAVKTIIEHMAQTLAHGHRIEIRGFGSFSLHYRAPRIGRNPKTGESVGLSGKYVPHFKPGKELRDRANESLVLYPMPAVLSDGEPDDS